MRDDRRIVRGHRRIHCRKSFRERAYLVRLDQNCVSHLARDALGKYGRLGNENIVPHQLHLAVQGTRQRFPTRPVVLRHAVLDAHHGILVRQFLEPTGEIAGIESAVFRRQAIHAVGIQLTGSHIQAQEEVSGHRKTGALDRLDQFLQGCGVGRKVRRETPFIADRRGAPGAAQDPLEHVVHLHTPAQGFGKAVRAHRQDHEFLHVQAVVGVRAAVDDVHHRRGHQWRSLAETLVKRDSFSSGRRAGVGQRDGQDCVGAQARTV